MARYEILITETLRKSVCVEADNCQSARVKAEAMYYTEDVVLTADDYIETEFEPIKLE